MKPVPSHIEWEGGRKEEVVTPYKEANTKGEANGQNLTGAVGVLAIQLEYVQQSSPILGGIFLQPAQRMRNQIRNLKDR